MTETPHSESATNRRPWLQFRLRTLFAVMTVLCCIGGWFAWQGRIVRERNETLVWLTSIGARYYGPLEGDWEPETNWARRLMGDHDIWLIRSKDVPFSQDERSRIRQVFPEATIEY
jgi:hypothetical protein